MELKISAPVTIALVGFVLIFLIVYSSVLLSDDVGGFRVLNDLASSRAIADVAIVIAEFGGEIVLILLAGLLYLFSKSDKLETTFLIVFAVVTSDIILLILKTAYFRPRPFYVLNGVILPIGTDGDSSFPSGHATRAFAVASLLLLKKGRKASLFVVLAGAVAVSRVILGVHFPLDVIGGALLGTLIGTISSEHVGRVFQYLITRLFPGRKVT